MIRKLRYFVLPGLLATSVALAQSEDWPNDWPMYARDLAGTRFSPLKQINAGNVSELVPVWSFKRGREHLLYKARVG